MVSDRVSVTGCPWTFQIPNVTTLHPVMDIGTILQIAELELLCDELPAPFYTSIFKLE
jgi:hypothetical protein